jgi:hypothetical protein
MKLVGDRIASLDRVGRLALSERNYGALAVVAEDLKEFSWRSEALGLYYQSISLNRTRFGNVFEAEQLARTLSESPNLTLRIGAPLLLAANRLNWGQIDEAKRLLLESNKALLQSRDLLYLANSQNLLAIYKSLEGDHAGSLRSLLGLKNYLPSLRFHYPATYFNYLNSISVELCELGFLEAAAEYIKPTLKSPYLKAYPEWRETAVEIQEAKALKLVNKSFVSYPMHIAQNEAVETQEAEAMKPVKNSSGLKSKPFARNVVQIDKCPRPESFASEPDQKKADLLRFRLPKTPVYLSLYDGERRFPVKDLPFNTSQDSLDRQLRMMNALWELCTERKTDLILSIALIPDKNDQSAVNLNIENWRLEDLLNLVDEIDEDLRARPLSEIQEDHLKYPPPPAKLVDDVMQMNDDDEKAILLIESRRQS